MKAFKAIVGTLLALVVLGSCSDTWDMSEALGEGRVLLRPVINSDIKIVSRAEMDAEEAALAESCTIWISGSKGLVRKFTGIQSIPTDGIVLLGGSYTAEAWAGDSVPASFDKRYFKGVERFDVEAGGTSRVDLTCRLANSAVSVSYDEKIDAVLRDYTMTVGHSVGSLTWEGRDSRRGYFMMNSRNKNLSYTLTGTRRDNGATYTLTGTIAAAAPATEYLLNVKFNPAADGGIGGLLFTIEIDATTIDIEDNITIVSAPIITSVGGNIAEPVYGDLGNVPGQTVYIAAPTQLKSVLMDSPSLEPILGVGASEIDMIVANSAVISTLAEKGLTSVTVHDKVNNVDNLKLTFSNELLSQLPDGEHIISLAATSPAGDPDDPTRTKTSRARLRIIVSDAKVEAIQVEENDPATWARRATIQGRVMKDGLGRVGFNYRAAGASEWTAVEAPLPEGKTSWTKGDTYSVSLTGLLPGVAYEYVATADDFVSSTVREVVTESPAQLPNAGFEDWSMDGNVQRISANPADYFWDSGNKGSATAGKNITTPSTDFVHEGTYSACLKTASMFGVMAAGNIFVGKFIGTEGTNGILGWGRKWTSRPEKLTAWVKYTPASISKSDASLGVNSGDPDKGILYIALLDDTRVDVNGEQWPVEIRTKAPKKLFDKNATNVIGYGEVLFTEATAGEGLVKVEIPITYKRTDVKASNIVVVGSASFYGDYFIGGVGSTMYLDDLQLIY